MTSRTTSPLPLRLDLRSRTGAAEDARLSRGAAATTLEVEVPALSGRIGPYEDVDLALLRQARVKDPATPIFFWESPDGEVVLGWGAVARFHSSGSQRFDDAHAWISRLAAEATLTGAPRGPRPESYLVALGGFAFAPDGAWGSGFDPASFVVPRVLVHRRPDVGTIRIVWSREDDPPSGEPLPVAPRSGWSAEIPCGALDEGLAERGAWDSSVREALLGIAAGTVEKVVLALRVASDLPIGFDALELLERLRRRHAGCYRFLLDFGLGGAFLGASPERLVTLRGQRVASDAIAGTATRPAEAALEAEAMKRLIASAKDRSEHDIVVRHIREAIEPFTTELRVGAEPEVQRLRRLLHLRTRLEGRTSKGTHVLDLARRLHPTPSVAGSPRDAALRWIAENEPGDRGWYAGPIGWMTAGGDGDFAVGLRGAFVSGRRALLAAGAGIVPGSDPAHEWTEAEGKLSVMRDAFEDA